MRIFEQRQIASYVPRQSASVGLQRHLDVFDNAEGRKQCTILKQDASAPAKSILVARLGVDTLTEHVDGAVPAEDADPELPASTPIYRNPTPPTTPRISPRTTSRSRSWWTTWLPN